MSAKTRIPPTAASIWLQGNEIWIALPTVNDPEGHCVQLPMEKFYTSMGDKFVRAPAAGVLLDILAEREKLGRLPTIADKAAPIKYDLEQVLKTMQITRIEAKKPMPEALSLEDLDI